MAMKFAIARRRALLGGIVAVLVSVTLLVLPAMAFADEISGESPDATSGLASPASAIDEIDGGHVVAGKTASAGIGGTESSDAEGAESLDGEAAGTVGDADDAVNSEVDSDASDAVVDTETSEDGAETGEDTEADEDDTSRDPEQAVEDASSCDPEQASEASASKDLDAAAQADASASEDGEDATAAAAAEDDAAATTVEYVNMYRLYNPNSGEHFYTSSLYEAASVCEAGWRYEGVGWVAPESSGTPVYRLYNPNAGDHHYTTSAYERDYLVSVGWNDEGIGWYSDDAQGIAVLRQYNPNAVAGAHNFTTSSVEDGSLVDAGWSAEGIAWYAASRPTQDIQGRWIVTSAWGSLERYWLDSTATIAKDRLVDPTTKRDSGAGWYAYAKSDGAVVRGTTQYGGKLFIADEKGALTDNTGWMVTDSYTDGALQRYYVDPSTHGMVIGFFQAEMDGSTLWFYGIPDTGYVSRGKYQTSNGVLVSDNEGKLLENDNPSLGMYVSSKWDGGAQRYYLVKVDGHIYAKTGLFSYEGNQYYGIENIGYLARNGNFTINGSLYSADNDAKLTYIGAPSRDTYTGTVTWSGDEGYFADMREYATSIGSATDYFITYDDTLLRVVVMKKSGSSWDVVQTWNCVGGQQTWKWTAEVDQNHTGGQWTIVHKHKCYWADEWYDKAGNNWSSCFVEAYSSDSLGHLRYIDGKGYEDCAAIHQTTYTTTGWYNSGCIGLLEDSAKWIYDNVPVGTKVYLFNPHTTG